MRFEWDATGENPPTRGVVLALSDNGSRGRRTVEAFLRQGLVFLVFLGLMLLSPGAQRFVLAQGQPAGIQQALVNLDRFLVLLEDLREQIDRTQFEVEELSFELAFEEPETIVAWVRENVAFEQYPGLLRGAQGTLMGRAGNALDQAVLLAQLLRDAGYDAVVSRGRLSIDQSEQLLAQLAFSSDRGPTFVDPDRARLLMEEMQSLSSSLGPEFSDTLDAAFAPREPGLEEGVQVRPVPGMDFLGEDVEQILVSMNSIELGAGEASLSDRIVDEASDYFWVQFRVSAAEEWRDAHPAFRAVGDEPAVEVVERFEDTVPAEFLHLFSFRVLLERSLGSETEEVVLVPSWERPVANLVGLPLTYSNLPDGLQEPGDYLNLDQRILASRFFIPSFSEGPVSTLFFDIDGNVVPAAEASSPYAGVFQELGQNLRDAGNILDTLDATATTAQGLLGQTVEYTLSSPDGTEAVYRKPILSTTTGSEGALPESETMSEGDIRWKLMTAHTFMIAAGEYPPGYVLDRTLSGMLELRPYFEAVGEAIENPSPESFEGLITASEGLKSSWLGHLELYGAFDVDPGLRPAIVYRSGPTLAVHEVEPIRDVGSIENTDVLQNPRRAFTLGAGGTPAFAFEEVVRAGVWESFVESLGPSENVQVPSAYEQIADRTASGDAFIRVDSSDQLRSIELPSEAKRHMEADLDSGFNLLVPQGLSAEATSPAAVSWWRVDPATGNTLARRGDGRGATKEYLVIFYGIAGTLIFALGVVRMVKCFGAEAEWGCYACAGAGMLFGALAVGIGVLGSEVVLAAYVIEGAEIIALAALIGDLIVQLGCELR